MGRKATAAKRANAAVQLQIMRLEELQLKNTQLKNSIEEKEARVRKLEEMVTQQTKPNHESEIDKAGPDAKRERIHDAIRLENMAELKAQSSEKQKGEIVTKAASLSPYGESSFLPLKTSTDHRLPTSEWTDTDGDVYVGPVQSFDEAIAAHHHLPPHFRTASVTIPHDLDIATFEIEIAIRDVERAVEHLGLQRIRQGHGLGPDALPAAVAAGSNNGGVDIGW